MAESSIRIDFKDGMEPTETFVLYEKIIEDRGSVYSVSIGRVTGKGGIKAFLKKLKEDKKYEKADHNSWATRISHQGAIFESKNDDKETGAGAVILRIMQKENVTNCIICVTRWFGVRKCGTLSQDLLSYVSSQ
jgi:putative IMPACT (imprinted ancient) family translation regulator